MPYLIAYDIIFQKECDSVEDKSFGILTKTNSEMKAQFAAVNGRMETLQI
jgi:hypothetical protein